MQIPTVASATGFPARIRVYQENRKRIRTEQLLPFAGQWIAFSADGKQIVACDKELADLEAKLFALGIDPQEVLFEHFDHGAATGAQIS
jgi:hypothetical protein